MFLASVFQLLHGSARALLLLVFLGAIPLGFCVRLLLCRGGAPLPVRLLPPVICAVLLLLFYSVIARWLPLARPVFQTLVRGGVLPLWGVCVEGFGLGLLLHWIYDLLRKGRRS